MNKTKIKNFAVWAREKLISDITYKAGMLGITENGIAKKLSQSTDDLHFFDIGTKNYIQISGKEISQRSALINAIKNKEKDMKNYKEAFQYIIEEAAYTWFNRLIAVRFMEVNDYLPSGIRVLSSEKKEKNEPDFVTAPFDTDLEFTPYEQDIIIQLKDDNKMDELFRMLFIKQCNKLHDILPELFEVTNDYTELLLTISFTDKDGVVYKLTHDIDEDDFNIEKEGQIEIIGWLYQYYNIEPKAEVLAREKGKKISKEEIPAVTQLFTPDWIVRYMVENSLGRIWIEGHPNSSLKDNWNYFIDEAEQEKQVIEKLEEIKAEYKNLTSETIKIIDPCMGSGHILVYAFDVLMQIYESNGYTQREAARSILKNNIFGLDIDKRAYQLAYFAVMMKARQYNRRILTEEIEPNLCFIKSSKSLSQSALDKMGEYKGITQQLITEFKDADEYGSLINISLSETDLQYISNQIEIVNSNKYNGNLIDIADCNELVTALIPLIKQAKMLIQKYDAVITNPPYRPVSDVSNKLNKYVKSNYPDSKTDLFAVFIERGFNYAKASGYICMVTMQSWMFLSRFEKMRKKVLTQRTITNLMHMENMVMGIAFGTTVTVFKNCAIKGFKGTYNHIKYEDIDKETASPIEFPVMNNRFAQVSSENFSKIPGSPIAYWVSKTFISAYQQSKLGDIGFARSGLQTGNNDLYLKYWYEVRYSNIAFKMYSKAEYLSSEKKWVPQIKGGEYRKWYGNFDYIVNWENDGAAIKSCKGCRLNAMCNDNLFFVEGITWSHTTSSVYGARFLPYGHLFNVEAPTYFNNNPIERLYVLGFLNSCIAQLYLNVMNSTMHYLVGNIITLPIYLKNSKQIDNIVRENINISKTDWDNFEISWNFKKHPLICYSSNTVAATFDSWTNDCDNRFNQLKANEEELNRIFIDIYGLQDELTPDVEDKDVTVRKADLKRDIKSLISYAVGCMFGRYSLDVDGLAYAGEDWDESKYKTFIPNTDNCIIITDEEYFEDDVVGLFCDWLKKVYGKDTLEQNLDFIASALNNKGKTSREIIRNYFLTDFIKDHIKTYQKQRPIYWLFDSGKQNGFKALVYMHRWNADTIGNMRVEYLHRMQKVYEKEIERMQEIIDNSRDNKEISKASKRKEKLQKQIKETKDYDAKVAHLALSRIDIDLDDGVKVNYEKVQTVDGKKMQILVKI